MLPTVSAIHPGNGVERSIGSGPGGWAPLIKAAVSEARCSFDRISAEPAHIEDPDDSEVILPLPVAQG
jgi:hypothetical protein